MFALCHLVIGMYLYAQVALGIDELHQQGELALIALMDGFAKDGLWVFFDNRHEVSTLPAAIANDAGTGGYSAHLPAFAYRLIRGLQALIWPELMTSPNNWMEVRGK